MIAYYGLLLFFVLEYARISELIPGLSLIRLNTLVPLGVFAHSLFARTKYSHQEVLRDLNSKLLIVFLGLIVISFAVADVTLYAFQVFTSVLGYTLIAFVI